MLKPVYLVAFSGHRPDGTPGRTDEALEATGPHLKAAFEALREKAGKVGGELHLISGVAAGADIVACEKARELGIPLHIILPKPEDEFLEAFGGTLESWKSRALALLTTARPTPGHPATDPRNTFRVGGISRTSPDCYAEANSRILEIADLLLTVTTGGKSKSIAGTRHLILEAEARDLPCINIDPAKPVFSKSRHEMAFDAFAKDTCASFEIFKDLAAHVTCQIDPKLPVHQQIAECISEAANRSSKSFRHAIATAICLHALAGFIAAGAASYFYALKHGQISNAPIISALLAGIELFLVALALWLEHRAKAAKKQQIWLQCRFARELMRGIAVANPFQDPLFPEVSRHHRDWGRFAATVGLLIRAEAGALDVTSSRAIADASNLYLKSRLQDQIIHFKQKAGKAKRRDGFWRHVAHGAGYAALVVVLLAFLVKIHLLSPAFLNYDVNPWWSASLLLLLPILLPLFASLSSSFLSVFDFGRRAVRYEEMVEALRKAARKLPVLDPDSRVMPALRNIESTVHQSEQVLLHELVEWLAAQKSGFGH